MILSSFKTRTIAAIVIACFAVMTGCNTYTRVPVADVADADTTEAVRWRVETAESVYVCNQVTVTDSTVVLEGQLESRLKSTHDYLQKIDVERVVLPSVAVTKIEYGKHSKGKTAAAWIGGIAAVATLTLFVLGLLLVETGALGFD